MIKRRMQSLCSIYFIFNRIFCRKERPFPPSEQSENIEVLKYELANFLSEAYMGEEDHSSGPEESESQMPTGLAVSKFLSRSRNSLNVSIWTFSVIFQRF